MMLYRLVHLVETRSEELAACLVERVNDSEATPAYESLPADELRDRVYEIYRRLGEWLLTKDELELERRYLLIGAERAHQGVPFS
jgi:hypothetical protein